jgi:hypothetical protein
MLAKIHYKDFMDDNKIENVNEEPTLGGLNKGRVFPYRTIPY